MPTHSDHHLLPPAALAALTDGLRAVIDDAGGAFTTTYETTS